MEFKLNEYHRDVSDEELLEDLRRVAELLKTDYFSRSEYQKLGKYGSSTITRRFGSWNNAIKTVGLKVNEVSHRRHDFLEKEEDFFSDMKLIAKSLEKILLLQVNMNNTADLTKVLCYTNIAVGIVYCKWQD